FDTRRTAQIVMHEQPDGPQQWWLGWPEADQTGLIAQETGQFSDADTLSGSLHLDERIVALHSRPGVFHRLAQEEWTGRGRSAGEGDQLMPAKPFSARGPAVLGNVPPRCVEGKPNFAEGAKHNFRGCWAREPDGEVGFASGNIQRAHTG